MVKVGAFLGTVAMFTIYGFGSARQNFVKAKIDIVEKYSLKSSNQWSITVRPKLVKIILKLQMGSKTEKEEKSQRHTNFSNTIEDDSI